MDAILILRLSYLLAASLILTVKVVPFLGDRFLAYGSRESNQQKRASSENVVSRVIDILASVRVPHSWFASFYVVSTFCSLIWASQVLYRGKLFEVLAGSVDSQHPAMTPHQVTVTWALMLIQGMRRLYECVAVSKPSSSKMWIGHWASGIWFYVSTSIAVWIDGSTSLLEHSFASSHFAFDAPSLRTFIAVLLFLFASGAQHDSHVHLASLKKYSLPTHPIFSSLVCPHYFAECLIYLSLAINAAPQGRLFNYTLLSALVFVATNLGITADETKQWYGQKFGSDGVRGRWRMVPYVY